MRKIRFKFLILPALAIFFLLFHTLPPTYGEILLVEQPGDFKLSADQTDFTTSQNPTFYFQSRVVDTSQLTATATYSHSDTSSSPHAIQISQANISVKKLIVPSSAFHQPGKYRLRINFHGQEYSQDFTWGVLALNPNKAHYQVGETANINLAALSDTGHTLCAAPLTLTVTSPSAQSFNPSITSNPTCTPDSVTDQPDYSVQFPLTELGQYELELTNTSTNFRIHDYLIVSATPPVTISRTGPTRIYPFAPYKMKLTINSDQDRQIRVVESVPSNFQLMGDLQLSSTSTSQLITWDIHVSKDTPYHLEYEFDAPDLTPYVFLLGPAQVYTVSPVIDQLPFSPPIASASATISALLNSDLPDALPSFTPSPSPSPLHLLYTEERQWQIASDAPGILEFTGFETGSNTNGYECTTVANTTFDTSTVRTGAYALRVSRSGTGVGHCRLRTFLTTTGASTAFNQPTVYYRFYFLYATKPASNTEEIFAAYDGSNVIKFALRIDSNGYLSAWDSALSQLSADNSTALAANTWYRLEAEVGTGSPAAYSVRIDGNQILSGTGNLGAANNGEARLGKITNRNSNTVDFYYDDFQADSTVFPGPGAVKIMVGDNHGTYSDWTNSFQYVNEVPVNTANYVESTLVVGQAETAALQSASSAGITGTISAVKSHSICRRTASASANGAIRLRLRSGSTDSDTGTNYGTTGSWAQVNRIFETDPADSTAWTVGDLDSIEVGALERSSTSGRNSWCAVFYAMVSYNNSSPTLSISQPDGTNDTVMVGDSYSITYSLADTDDTVTVAMYYDSTASGLDGSSISGACATAAEGSNQTCTWDTTGMTPGSYYIYGLTTDGVNPQVSAYSPGQITISSGYTMSGYIYTSESLDAYNCDIGSGGNPLTVNLRVNGSGTYTTTCTQDTGYWSISSVSISTGQTLVAYLDEETENASTVVISDQTAKSDINLIVNRLIIRDDADTSITNSEIASGETSDPDNEDLFTVSGGNLTVAASSKLIIPASTTFVPGGNIEAPSFAVAGAYSPGSTTLQLTGSGTSQTCTSPPGTVMPFCVTGNFTSGTSTILFEGSSDTAVENETYYNIGVGTVADTNSGVNYSLTGNTTAANIFTVGNASSTNPDVLLGGSGTLTFTNLGTPFNLTAKGTFTPESTTIKYTPPATLSGWNYRKIHTVTSASGAGTNYQICLKVYYGSGTDGTETVNSTSCGKVYLNSQSKTDFGDIRFTKSDKTTLIDYWLESKTDSDNAVFWVEIPDDLSSTNQSIYIYYGNPNVNTTSNAANTLLWYDDFNRAALGSDYTVDGGTWSIENNTTLQQTNATGPYYQMYVTGLSGLTDYEIRYRWRTDTGSNTDSGGVVRAGSTNVGLYLERRVGGAFLIRNAATQLATGTLAGPGTDWHTHIAQVWGSGASGRYRFYEDNVQVIDLTTDLSLTSGAPGFASYETAAPYRFDDFFVRKFISPEPAHGSWGEQESAFIKVSPGNYNHLEVSPAANSVTIILGTAVSQTLTIGGNFVVGNGTNTNTIIESTSYDPSLSVVGTFTVSSNSTFTGSDSGSATLNLDSHLTINSGGIFIAPSGTTSTTFTLAGNFTNNGTFTANSGTLTLDNSAISTEFSYAANTTFYSLSVPSTSAGKQLRFDQTSQTIVTHNLTLQGSNCTTGRIFLDSLVDNNQWDLVVTGATVDIDYVDVEDANAITTAITAENSTEVNTNNTNWTVNAGSCTAGISLSGNVYTDDDEASPLNSVSVCVAVNSTHDPANCDTTVLGAFSITGISATSGSEQLTLFIDGGSYLGNLVTIGTGSSLANLKLYQNHVLVRHDLGTQINITHLDAYDNDQNSADLLFDAEDLAQDTLTLETGSEFYVPSGVTFVPNGNVTAVDVEIDGTWNASTGESLGLTGTFKLDTAGSFSASTSTLSFIGSTGTSSLITAGTGSLYNLTLNDGGGSLVVELEDELDVDNDLTITSGTLDTKLNENNTLHVGRHFSNDDTFLARSSVVVLDGSSSANLDSGCSDVSNCPNQGFYDLMVNKTSPATTVSLTHNLLVSHTLTLTSGVLSQSSYNIRALGTPAIDIGASGTWSNQSTGDVSLSGSVTNSGTVNLQSQGSCGGNNEIVITSVSGTPSWSGAGDFNLSDLSISTQNAAVQLDVYSGTNAGGNTGSWSFYPGCDNGNLVTDIVDAGGNSVASPVVILDTRPFAYSSQSTTGTLGISAQKLRVSNTTANSQWNLSIAASSGPTSTWSGGGYYYDFNDPTSNTGDGGDADNFGGQLTLNPAAMSVTPQSGCSSTGLSLGSQSAFNEGVVNSITLLTSGSTSGVGCYWDLTNGSISQTIPPEQNSGSYSIDLTLSIVAI